MSVVKKTVSLSSDLVEEVKNVSSNFSLVVEEHFYVTKALESFGKWQPRAEDSVTLTNEMRKENERWNHIQSSN